MNVIQTITNFDLGPNGYINKNYHKSCLYYRGLPILINHYHLTFYF